MDSALPLCHVSHRTVIGTVKHGMNGLMFNLPRLIITSNTRIFFDTICVYGTQNFRANLILIFAHKLVEVEVTHGGASSSQTDLGNSRPFFLCLCALQASSSLESAATLTNRVQAITKSLRRGE